MRRLDVINRGFSGYNTANALGILTDLFPPPSPTSPKIDYIVRPTSPWTSQTFPSAMLTLF